MLEMIITSGKSCSFSNSPKRLSRVDRSKITNIRVRFSDHGHVENEFDASGIEDLINLKSLEVNGTGSTMSGSKFAPLVSPTIERLKIKDHIGRLTIEAPHVENLEIINSKLDAKDLMTLRNVEYILLNRSTITGPVFFPQLRLVTNYDSDIILEERCKNLHSLDGNCFVTVPSSVRRITLTGITSISYKEICSFTSQSSESTILRSKLSELTVYGTECDDEIETDGVKCTFHKGVHELGYTVSLRLH